MIGSGTAKQGGPILLIGRAGQVGWELERTLATLGPVVAWGRPDLELTDGAQVRARVRSLAPALIVNAAAYNAVDKAETEGDLAMAVNALAPGILAEEAERLNAVIVHYSTDYVFDGRDPATGETIGRPFRETDRPRPLSAYGASKLGGEDSIRETGAAHLIFRVAWVHSRRGRGFLSTIAKLSREREELRVVDDQVGTPTWARHIASATAQILAQTWAREGRVGVERIKGVYHLTSGGEASRFGFAEALLAALGQTGPGFARLVPVPTSAFPTPAARPLYSVLDSAKAEAAFGIRIPDWRLGLAQSMDEGFP